MPARTYDDLAPHYDKAMRPLDRWFLARLRATALRYLPEGARVLELGAGTGLNFVFYPTNTVGVATEPSSGMLRLAREKEKPDRVRLIQSCAEHLPFKNNSFDAAFATLVFCSLARPAEAFSELRRVVKSGGPVILLEHVRPSGLLGPVFDLLNLITVPLFDDHFNRRTAEEAQANGLELVKVERSLLGIINLIACRV
ncbi:MAG TPA: SAM-dependent methyltransferase [Blastocatellia bacterium]|jgi:ubiquinone/menaquinone biosynthesis C-methylase UbiE|nr:SAM-dependent methyltransferase [Blastocatellia bacterium]HAF23660.1 SAM-dependent methyltransferase [Blastocatellia bacterium]HCX30998.1 SAM-dependent methyltransferase [Blastocatellia bacterium]